MLSLPIKWWLRIFCPVDLRSGRFRDLPIKSLWGNMKMLPDSLKPTETTHFLQDHSTHPICDDRVLTYNWWSAVTGGSSGVTWGHNPFFANNSPQKGDRHSQIVPNDLAHLVRKICIMPYLDHDLTLTWPGPRSDYEVDLSRSNDTLSEPARWAEYDGVIFVSLS